MNKCGSFQSPEVNPTRNQRYFPPSRSGGSRIPSKKLYNHSNPEMLMEAVKLKQGIPINISKNIKPTNLYRKTYRAEIKTDFKKPRQVSTRKKAVVTKRKSAVQTNLVTKKTPKKSTMLWNTAEY